MSNTDHRYRFDDELNFKESDTLVERVGRFLLRVAGVALVLTVLGYLIVALTINTDLEGRLKRENKMYEKLYPQLLPQQALLDDAIAGLQLKDDNVYREVFHSQAPSVDPINTLSFLNGNDTIPETKIIAYTAAKAEGLYSTIDEVEANFRRILLNVAGENRIIPPMRLPVEDISFSQVGASKGNKLNPFYKAYIAHDGLDFIVSQGSPVYATADGRVSVIDKSSKGLGNMITITHPGGYVTRYAHLSTISVRQGQSVRSGDKIGTVGISGTTFAPHLHYEVMLNGVHMDPINYIFASVSPEEYSNMLYMAVNTQQSMD